MPQCTASLESLSSVLYTYKKVPFFLTLKCVLTVPGHLLFSKEEGTGPLALEFVTGSIDEQRNSPFPKEQEQQPRKMK